MSPFFSRTDEATSLLRRVPFDQGCIRMHGNGNLAVGTDFDSLRMVVSVKTKRFGDIAHPYPGLPPTYVIC
jgi:hypothetical protein